MKRKRVVNEMNENQQPSHTSRAFSRAEFARQLFGPRTLAGKIWFREYDRANSLEEMPNREIPPRPIGRRLVLNALLVEGVLPVLPPPQPIPAHTTRFRHLSLKSRWPPSLRSSSPWGMCRYPIPHLRVRAAARRARCSHDQASVQFVTDTRTRPPRPRARRTRTPRALPTLPRRLVLASIVDSSTARPPAMRA